MEASVRQEEKRTHKLCNHWPLEVIINATKISDCTSNFCLPHNWKICFFVFFSLKLDTILTVAENATLGSTKEHRMWAPCVTRCSLQKGSECLSGSDGEKSSLSYARTEEVTVTFAGPLPHESDSEDCWPPPLALIWSQASPSALAKWSSTEPVMDTELDTGSASL